MKAVFVLAIILVIAAVVVNAEEEKKHKHERHRKHKHDKDHNHGKADRNHHGKKEKHAKKHEGTKERDHKKHDSTKNRNARKPFEETANSHKKSDRDGHSECPPNEVACCRSSHCAISCGDNFLRQSHCTFQNWLTDIRDKVTGIWKPKKDEGMSTPVPDQTETGEHTASGGSECGPHDEHFKCICAEGYILNGADGTCVEKDKCPKERNAAAHGAAPGTA